MPSGTSAKSAVMGLRRPRRFPPSEPRRVDPNLGGPGILVWAPIKRSSVCVFGDARANCQPPIPQCARSPGHQIWTASRHLGVCSRGKRMAFVWVRKIGPRRSTLGVHAAKDMEREEDQQLARLPSWTPTPAPTVQAPLIHVYPPDVTACWSPSTVQAPFRPLRPCEDLVKRQP